MADRNEDSSGEIAGMPSAADLAALTATPEAATDDGAKAVRELSPAARRALAEAEERRRKADESRKAETEIGGRGGLDPARFGDWEIKGRAIDF